MDNLTAVLLNNYINGEGGGGSSKIKNLEDGRGVGSLQQKNSPAIVDKRIPTNDDETAGTAYWVVYADGSLVTKTGTQIESQSLTGYCKTISDNTYTYYKNVAGEITETDLSDIQSSINKNPESTGGGSLAAGIGTLASNDGAVAEGYGTIASGYASHAENHETTASGEKSHAEGGDTVASGSCSHAEGDTTIASGKDSHAEGEGSVASEYDAHAEGDHTASSGHASHAEGDLTSSSGHASHAEGQGTIARGKGSHAEGVNTLADKLGTPETSGQGAHAEGVYSKATGQGSHAEGCGTADNNRIAATGEGSHAEGYVTKSTRRASHSEGYYTEARSIASHAEGYYTLIPLNQTDTDIGTGAHAEGYGTQQNPVIASHTGAHAEGISTIASGQGAHSGGNFSEASGENSFAHGDHVTAAGVNETVFGQYNDESYAVGGVSPLLSVGNGTDSSAKSTAFAVGQNGNIEVGGDIATKKSASKILFSDRCNIRSVYNSIGEDYDLQLISKNSIRVRPNQSNVTNPDQNGFVLRHDSTTYAIFPEGGTGDLGMNQAGNRFRNIHISGDIYKSNKKCLFVPAPQTTGTYILKSVDGVLSWVAQ